MRRHVLAAGLMRRHVLAAGLMRRRLLAAALLLLGLVPLAGCAGAATSGAGPAATGTGPAAAPARERGSAATAVARPQPPEPAIYRLDALNRTEAARLDRSACYLLQPVAPLSLCGPHLPSGTLIRLTDDLTAEIARRLRQARPDWSVVVMPTLPVGASPTTELGGIYFHPSSAGLSFFTLRDFLAGWGINPAENAFLNCFFVSLHADPAHQKAMNDVAEFYFQNYGMMTGSVMSYLLADSTWRADARALEARLPAGRSLDDLPFELAGGAALTSLMLHLHPELVGPDYATLDPQPAASWEAAVAAVRTLGWPGYLGHPAAATADYGRALFDHLAAGSARWIQDAAAGAPHRDQPRFEDLIQSDFSVRESIRGGQRFYGRLEQRIGTWLKTQAAADKAAHGNKSIER